MSHYGRDYSPGGYGRHRGTSFRAGYDLDYGERSAGGPGWYGGGNRSWNDDFDRYRGWDEVGPGHAGWSDLGESRDAFTWGRGRQRMGGEGWGRQEPARWSRYSYDRELRGGFRVPTYGMRGEPIRGRSEHRYDSDLGDRIRRGWNHFRDEARGWIGRGYDRGW